MPRKEPFPWILFRILIATAVFASSCVLPWLATQTPPTPPPDLMDEIPGAESLPPTAIPEVAEDKSPVIEYPEYQEEPYIPPPPSILDAAPQLPEKAQGDPVDLHLFATPGQIAYDGYVTFSAIVTNDSTETLTDLEFVDQLESGFSFLPDVNQSVSFDANTSTISYAIPELAAGEQVTFNYTLQVTAPTSSPSGELWVHTAETNSKDGAVALKASAELWVGQPALQSNIEVARLDKDGGWAETENASIYIEPNALQQDAIAVISPVAVDSGPDLQFQVELYETENAVDGEYDGLAEQQLAVNQEVSDDLAIPAFMEVDFDDLGDLDALPGGKEPFVTTYIPELDVWVKMPPTLVNYENNTVTVETDHFSTWGAGIGDSLPQNGANVLLFDQPYTSLFTGSARYSIPIWTPPGRTGMQPGISLSYSSATVDGVLGDVQASWVGMGWNMDAIEIVRKIDTDENGYGYVDEYSLTFNGALHTLIEDTDEPNRYYTTRGSFLYIERHNEALENADGVNNTTHEWWEVVATDGTRYRLGWNEDSEQLALMYGYECSVGSPCDTPEAPYDNLGYAGIANDLIAMRWRVDRITDTHGNYVEYTYHEEQPDAASNIPAFDRESYMDTIDYTGWDDPNGVKSSLAPGYQVHFVRAARGEGEDQSPLSFGIYDNWDSQLLDKIEICYGSCASGTIVRTYDLGYSAPDVPNSNGTLTLNSIDISGSQISESGQTINAATAPTISFTYENGDNRDQATPPEEEHDLWSYPRLKTINNGYGAVLTYTYEHDERDGESWYNYRVTQVTANDGTGVAAVTGYEYSDPKYTDVGGEGEGELIGHEYVTQTTYEANGSTAIVDNKTRFGIEGQDTGRTIWTEVLHPTNGTKYSKVVNTYVTDNSQAPFTGWEYRYLLQTETYQRYNGALVLTSKSVNQNDGGTGNLLSTQTYLGGSLVRKTHYEYMINSDPDVYILDKVSRQYVLDASNNEQSDTRYQYDNGALTQGELALVQTLVDADVNDDTVDARYIYDDYGNVTETRSYTSYGAMGSSPTGNYQKTVTGYDSTLHTFPTSVANHLFTAATTDYLYTLGVPYKVTDANGYVTQTQYDVLGRVVRMALPGFNLTSTYNVEYTYNAPVSTVNYTTHSIQMKMRDTLGPLGPGGQTPYRSVWGIYDGFGRIIQNQVEDADNSKLLISDTDFNAQGLAWRTSIPHSESGTGGTYQPPSWGSLKLTTTDYDLLGRATQVTAPGNISSQTQYNGLEVTAINPNGEQITRLSDGLGRLISVREYDGSALYATTVYSYDHFDRLTKVTDDVSNVTTISYDWLGRKTGMDDPDMGDWSYSYDPQGNLTSQTDARDTTLTFFYDELNRLTEKKHGSTQLAKYIYDEYPESTPTEIEWGQRLYMKDEDTSETAWTFSDSGRTVTETRDLDGITSDYTFITTTDWLGRVDTIVYPGSETVTYDYDAMGRATSFDSSEITGDLATLAYNTLGQLTDIDLGNGVDIDNSYDANTLRLDERVANDGTNDLLNFSYQYDDNGNITQLDDDLRGEILTFDYDHLNRLATAEAIEGSDYIYRQEFDYDTVGNIEEVRNWWEDIIFKDDFETSLDNDWTEVPTSTTKVTIDSAAANGGIVSSDGLKVQTEDTSTEARYLKDANPNESGRYRARFYLDTNTITIPADTVHTIFKGWDGVTSVLTVELQYTNDGQNDVYQLRAGAWDDTASAFSYGQWRTIGDTWHGIELDWQSVANDGILNFFLDGTVVDIINDLDNGGQTVTDVHLGLVDGVASSSTGSLYFDAFESRQVSHIGLLPSPQAMEQQLVSAEQLVSLRNVDAPEGSFNEIRYAHPPAPPANGYANVVNPAPVQQTTIFDNMVAYWDLDEASGSRLDSHTNDYDLTDNATVTQSTGIVSNAADFTAGNGEYLSYADTAWLSAGDNDFSMTAWVYPDALTDSMGIISKYTDGDTREYYLYYDAGIDRFVFLVYDATGSLIATATASTFGSPSAGQWHFLYAYHDATNDEIGISVNDGTIDTAATNGTAPADTDATFQIGKLGSQEWDGRIDEVGFWKRVLSGTDLDTLYNTGSGATYPFSETAPTPTVTMTPTPTATPTQAPPNNEVLEWKLDENTGTVVEDETTNDRDGTLYNGPSWVTGISNTSALSFDSALEEVASDGYLPDLDNGFTLSAWVFPENLDDTEQWVAAAPGGGVVEWGIAINSDNHVEFRVADLDPNVVTGPVLPENTWSHIVGVYDSIEAQIYLYVNGIRVASAEVTGDFDDGSPKLYLSKSVYPFEGRIDEVKLYDRDLTANEINASLYLVQSTPTPTPGPTPLPGIRLDMMAYWDFETSNDLGVDIHDDNDLTNNSTVTQTDGVVENDAGNAAQFTTTAGNSLSISDNADLSTGDIDFSLGGWVYLDTKSSWPQFITRDEGGSGREYWLGYNSVADRFGFYIYNSNGTNVGYVAANTFGSPSVDQWYYVYAEHDAENNTVGISINGGTLDTSSTSGVPSDTSIATVLGGTSTGNLDGRLDDWGFWKRLLTNQERTDLYNAGRGWEYPFEGTPPTALPPTATPTPIPADLTSGLISYWKLDEDTGTREDSAGSNDLTDNNTVGNTVGMFGNAADMENSSAEYLYHADNADLSFGDDDFTISAWVRLESKPGIMGIVSKGYTGSPYTQEYTLYYTTGTQRFGFYVTDPSLNYTAVSASTTDSPALHGWYHVVAWHDSTNDTVNIQVNNGQVYSTSHTTGVLDGTTNFIIGRQSLYNYDGAIDEVGLWDRVLNSTEREALFNQSNGLIYPLDEPTATPAPDDLTDGLISHWDLDEEVDTVRSDSHGDNDLNDTNSVEQVLGVLGHAGDFERDDLAYLSISDDIDLRMGDESFSISAWVKLESKPGILGIVSKTVAGSPYTSEYSLYYTTDNNRFNFYINDGTNYAAVAADDLGVPALDTWYHILGWYDAEADTINIQVNNGVVDSKDHSGGALNGSTPLLIGRYLQYNHDGLIDEVSIWNRTLTTAERASLYNSGNGFPYPFSNNPTPTPTLGPPTSQWGTGADGDVIIPTAETKNLHTDTLASGRTCADGGDGVVYNVTYLSETTAKLDSAPGTGCLRAGDEVLLMNMQGISTNYPNAGNYDLLRIATINGDVVTFVDAKQHYYGEFVYTDSSIGTAAADQKVILQRVPNYKNLTVTGTLEGEAWDGSNGGILAFRVLETFDGAGTVDLTDMGYRLGAGFSYQGEGYCGPGIVSNSDNCSGGAGGNHSWLHGHGGSNASSADLSTLFIAGGGGGPYGESHNGRPGAGALIAMAHTVEFSGTIDADGMDGAYVSGVYSGPGAGGSILIEGDVIDLSSATFSAEGGTAASNGGDGVIAIYYSPSSTPAYATPGSISPSAYEATVTPTPPTMIAPNEIHDELQAYWSMDEVEGTRYDSWGSHDLAGGGALQAQGVVGPAADFDGVNDVMSHADSTYLSTGDIDFSIGAWVYVDDATHTGDIISKYSISANQDYRLGYSSTSKRFFFSVISDSGSIPSLSANDLGDVQEDTWYYVMAYHDADNDQIGIKVYDGTGWSSDTQDTNEVVPRDGDASFRIGGLNGYTYLDGFIDEVGIWKRLLTDHERDYIVNEGSGRAFPFNDYVNPGPQPTATPDTTLLNSLQAYWKLDESSGTRMDAHGFSHLSDNNSVTSGTGLLNDAAQFDKTNSEYLSRVDNDALSLGDFDFSYAFWVKLDSKGTSYPILTRYETASDRSIWMGYSGASDRFNFGLYNSAGNGIGWVYADTFGSPSVDTWYFVYIEYDAANDTVGVSINNGRLDTSSTTGTPADGTAAFKLGYGAGSSYYHDGRIDELGFWKRLLTSDERNELYNSGSGLAYPFGDVPTETPAPPLEPDWVAHEYSYDANHPHAVSQIVRNKGEATEYTDTFTYDDNGNMTCRYEDGEYWKQSYNAENRLNKIELMDSSCAGTVQETWTFYYDGNGSRIKETHNDGTTTTTNLFLGPLTVNDAGGVNEEETRYYSIAGQRVALLVDAGGANEELNYLLTDHLGSVVAVLDDTGTVVSDERYLPFGSSRGDLGGISETDFSYTGQRGLPSTGLMDYNARWYSPSLGRFTQPDSIVPNFFNPQSLNRYSYTYNNPIIYTDPTGHIPMIDGLCSVGSSSCNAPKTYDPKPPILAQKPPSYCSGFSNGPGCGGSYSESNSKDYNGSGFSKPLTSLKNTVTGYTYGSPEGHPGEDLAPPSSDPNVYASGNGQVVAADECTEPNSCICPPNQDCRTVGYNTGYGNVVIVEYAWNNLPPEVKTALLFAGANSGSSLYILYAHLKNPPPVFSGKFVNANDVLGEVGSTGQSTGPHLHLEARFGEPQKIDSSVEYCSNSGCLNANIWANQLTHINPQIIPGWTIETNQ
ncbi:MAG: hypothetical protein DWQ07_15420 [Chloroflexi bacterium]|nr:MAG: hypothetical protein DWQ07_15420 [Chloroflexota bacterium]